MAQDEGKEEKRGPVLPGVEKEGRADDIYRVNVRIRQSDAQREQALSTGEGKRKKRTGCSICDGREGVCVTQREEHFGLTRSCLEYRLKSRKRQKLTGGRSGWGKNQRKKRASLSF